MKLNWRTRVALVGSLGLLANAGLMFVLALWHGAHPGQSWLGAMLADQSSERILTLLIFFVLLGIALGEIPFTLRRLRALVRAPGRPADWAVALFVFFAAVYAAVLMLLTQRLDLALTIGSTGVVRLAAIAFGVIGFKKTPPGETAPKQ